MAIKAKNNSHAEFMPQNVGRFWKKLTWVTKTLVTFGYDSFVKIPFDK